MDNLSPRQKAYLERLGVKDISQLKPAQRAWLTILGKKDGVEPAKPVKVEQPSFQPISREVAEKLGIKGLAAANKANLRWEKYGIVEVPINYGGERSGYKAIIRKGKLVQIAGEGYKLLPNEEVVALADELAEAVGAKPFTEFRGRWYDKMGNHVIYNRDETQMHALYHFPEPLKVEGVDECYVGYDIYNSIDGSTGFGVQAFTFRFACSNLVIVGNKGMRLDRHLTKVLAWVQQRHSPGLKVDRPNLQNIILSVIDKAKNVLNMYHEMAQIKLNEKIARRIAESDLPKRVLPDYIEVETVDDRRTLKGFDPRYTVWDTYNTITEAIWHNAKSDIDTKINQFNQLHQAIIPTIH